MDTNTISLQAPQTAQLNSAQPPARQSAAGVDENGLGFMQLLSAMLGIGQAQALEAQLKKQAETLGAQMNAEQFGAGMNAELLAINPLLALALAGQADLGAGPQAAPDLLTQQPAALTPEALHQAELLAQLQLPADNANPGRAPQGFAVPDAPIGFEAAAVLTAAQDGSDGALALQGQSQFERAVSQAHRLIKEAGGESRTGSAELDLEALQKKVDSGAFLPHLAGAATSDASVAVAVAESGDTPDAQEIFSQIKASVTRHAKDGTTDFTIKLRPEGLGEITVRLLEAGGKMTLSLTASDLQVQRLLGSELNHLRDIMRPYQVEVSQIVQTGQAPGMDLQQQFSQQFSQQRFSGQQQTAAAYDADYGESALADGQPASGVLPDAVLDAYI